MLCRSYGHRTGRGVIHRDIKPANIMVDREGDAFVTDFGISKIAESKSGLTQTGATIGTPEYMSPEQCRGEELTGASDQYALGVVAYEMLCGHTPFSGSQYFIMVAHTSEQPKPIRETNPDCPPDLAEAVERMLAKTPGERWPDLDAAVAEGTLPVQDTELAAYAWMGALNEIILRWLYTGTPEPLESAAPALQLLLLNSVGANKTRVEA